MDGKEWYDKHWVGRETVAFVAWFVEWYGAPEGVPDLPGELDEYWTRRAFALAGWLGREAT